MRGQGRDRARHQRRWEHEPATAAELQLLRESVEEAARCNVEADAGGRGCGRGRFGHHGGERVASCADAGGGHTAVTAEVQQRQASHASQLDELGERLFEACLAAKRLLDEQLCLLRLKEGSRQVQQPPGPHTPMWHI